jgi:hypothetical protein
MVKAGSILQNINGESDLHPRGATAAQLVHIEKVPGANPGAGTKISAKC